MVHALAQERTDELDDPRLQCDRDPAGGLEDVPPKRARSRERSMPSQKHPGRRAAQLRECAVEAEPVLLGIERPVDTPLRVHFPELLVAREVIHHLVVLAEIGDLAVVMAALRAATLRGHSDLLRSDGW